jgi:hypothetical protein
MKDSCNKITPSTGYELLLQQEDAADPLRRTKVKFLMRCIVVTILSLAFVFLIFMVIAALTVQETRLHCKFTLASMSKANLSR